LSVHNSGFTFFAGMGGYVAIGMIWNSPKNAYPYVHAFVVGETRSFYLFFAFFSVKLRDLRGKIP